jgi:pSer/pThr/pTyr-binding forkhead associated (FHA) protein
MPLERFEARFPWCFLAVLTGSLDLTIQYTTRQAAVEPDKLVGSVRIVDLLPMVKTAAAYSGQASLVVGRSRACDLWLQDASVSKTHARFTMEKDRPSTLTDLGSRNKTRVCGDVLTPQVPLGVRLGDFITFGSVPAQLLDAKLLHPKLL